MGLHPQVRSPHRAAQEAGRGAMAPPVADGPLIIGDARLPGAVVVGVALDAEFRGAADEGLANRMALVMTFCPISAGRAILRAAEIGQNVIIGPAAIAELRPDFEVARLAADIEAAVDRARPAEHLAAREEDRAAVDAGTRLRAVAPVEARVAEGFQKPGRRADIGMGIRAAGFEDEDGNARIGGQPIGEHAPGRAGADDDVIIAFRFGRFHRRHSPDSAPRRRRARHRVFFLRALGKNMPSSFMPSGSRK